MARSCSETDSPGSGLCLSGLVGSVFPGSPSPAPAGGRSARAADARASPGVGRPGRRAFAESGGQAYQRGDLTTAVEKNRQLLAIMERLYPKDGYPQGHPDLATSLNNLGSCSRPRGTTARRGGTSSGRWR